MTHEILILHKTLPEIPTFRDILMYMLSKIKIMYISQFWWYSKRSNFEQKGPLQLLWYAAQLVFQNCFHILWSANQWRTALLPFVLNYGSFISRFISSMMRCISRRICSIYSRRISCSTKESSRRLLSNFSGLKSWAWTGVKRRKSCKSRIPMKKAPTATQGTVERPESLFKAVLCIAPV